MEFLPLLLIMALFLVPMLLMNNRQKKVQQQTREMQSSIGVGDEVRTYSGFYGLVIDEYDDVVILETESGAQTKWARQSVAQKVVEPVAAVAPVSVADVDAEAQDTAYGTDPTVYGDETPVSDSEQPGTEPDARR